MRAVRGLRFTAWDVEACWGESLVGLRSRGPVVAEDFSVILALLTTSMHVV